MHRRYETPTDGRIVSSGLPYLDKLNSYSDDMLTAHDLFALNLDESLTESGPSTGMPSRDPESLTAQFRAGNPTRTGRASKPGSGYGGENEGLNERLAPVPVGAPQP